VRPAVDVLFRSMAETYGCGTLAVVLTGMGQDGMKGSEPIVAAGGQVVVQDEATSVVWGMPGSVAHAGFAHQILPLDDIAEHIQRVAQRSQSARPDVALGARS
jgi:two-component system chemotaxis response regulator CheB